MILPDSRRSLTLGGAERKEGMAETALLYPALFLTGTASALILAVALARSLATPDPGARIPASD